MRPRAQIVWWPRRYSGDDYGNPCPDWADTVAGVMRTYFRSGPSVRWKDALEAVGR